MTVRCPRCGYGRITYGQFLCRPCTRKAEDREEIDVSHLLTL